MVYSEDGFNSKVRFKILALCCCIVTFYVYNGNCIRNKVTLFLLIDVNQQLHQHLKGDLPLYIIIVIKWVRYTSNTICFIGVTPTVTNISL